MISSKYWQWVQNIDFKTKREEHDYLLAWNIAPSCCVGRIYCNTIHTQSQLIYLTTMIQSPVFAAKLEPFDWQDLMSPVSFSLWMNVVSTWNYVSYRRRSSRVQGPSNLAKYFQKVVNHFRGGSTSWDKWPLCGDTPNPKKVKERCKAIVFIISFRLMVLTKSDLCMSKLDVGDVPAHATFFHLG